MTLWYYYLRRSSAIAGIRPIRETGARARGFLSPRPRTAIGRLPRAAIAAKTRSRGPNTVRSRRTAAGLSSSAAGVPRRQPKNKRRATVVQLRPQTRARTFGIPTRARVSPPTFPPRRYQSAGCATRFETIKRIERKNGGKKKIPCRRNDCCFLPSRVKSSSFPYGEEKSVTRTLKRAWRGKWAG